MTLTVRFAPAYSSQSSGSIERFHRTLAGHIRTLRTQVQQNYNTRLPTTHPIMAWAVRHSAYLINRFLIRADGYTSYHKRWGRTHNAALCEFGETVMYMVQSIKQRPKLEPRFYKGIWLGKCTSTGESFIGIAGRIVRSRTIRRLAGTNRYDAQLMDTITGTPWNPTPPNGFQPAFILPPTPVRPLLLLLQLPLELPPLLLLPQPLELPPLPLHLLLLFLLLLLQLYYN